MKRIIDGATYDTEKDTVIREWSNIEYVEYVTSNDYSEATLYQAADGQYYIWQSGTTYAGLHSKDESITLIVEALVDLWIQAADGKIPMADFWREQAVRDDLMQAFGVSHAQITQAMEGER